MPATPSNDVFLSYSHRDNEAFGVEQRRWVSDFRKDLAVRLGVYLGREPKVWMDLRQPGEIDFAKDIEGQLKSTALLVAVLSPSYVQSTWCGREMTEFVATALATGGLCVDNACRVLKVFKLPVERERVSELNPELDRPLGFEFFEIDRDTNVARELSIHEDPQIRKRYDPRVDDVAQAACRVLSKMGLAERVRRTAGKGAVYLAETTQDLVDQSLKLRRELEARGYEIVPQYQLPVRGVEAQAAILGGLKRARCSIHLFGARTGWIPEGESRSVVRLQHELAAQRDGNGFTRFLWIPPGLVAAETAQEAFLLSLRQMQEPRHNFELAEVPFEELKAIILEKLSTNGDHAAVKARPRRVYLVCVAADDEAAQAMAGRLMDAGAAVDVPLRSSDPAADARDHLETLKRADVVVVYWAQSDLGWVRQLQRDLRDVREAAPPGPAACLVIAGPETPHKRAYRGNDLDVVRVADAADLQPLIQVVECAPLRKGAPQ